MTIKDLKNKIKDLPDNMEVLINQTDDQFNYSGLNSVTEVDVRFSDGDTYAYDKSIILSDEF